jgi:hypothetical protein
MTKENLIISNYVMLATYISHSVYKIFMNKNVIDTARVSRRKGSHASLCASLERLRFQTFPSPQHFENQQALFRSQKNGTILYILCAENNDL